MYIYSISNLHNCLFFSVSKFPIDTFLCFSSFFNPIATHTHKLAFTCKFFNWHSHLLNPRKYITTLFFFFICSNTVTALSLHQNSKFLHVFFVVVVQKTQFTIAYFTIFFFRLRIKQKKTRQLQCKSECICVFFG